MFFQLLAGMHVEGGKVYSVKLETHPETGARIVARDGRPIIKSDKDLAKIFGADKFRRLTKGEASLLLAESSAAGEQSDTSASAPAASAEVQKAVKKGASAIAEPPGVDVKSKFPELADYPNVDVFFKRGKGYFVCIDGETKTEEPLKRDEVTNWVQSFMEG